AGNEDLLARAGTGRGQSKPDGLGILAVIIIIDGAIQFFDLEHDFEVVAMNDDPLNCAPNQFTYVCAPDAGREVGEGRDNVATELIADMLVLRSNVIVGSDKPGKELKQRGT